MIYFVGTQGLLCHDENDHRSFRLYTAQLIDQDACRQIDLTRAFGVTKSSLARALKTLRAGGAEAFFASRRTRGALGDDAGSDGESPAVAGGGLEPIGNRR